MKIYKLASIIHDQKKLDSSTQNFLKRLEQAAGIKMELTSLSDYDFRGPTVIYIQTGGTEGIFLQHLNNLTGKIYLLTSKENNSLAASLEILAYINNHTTKQGEILHGDEKQIGQKLSYIYKAYQAQLALKKHRLGVIGEPSDWLIASRTSASQVKECFGIELINIDIGELIDYYANLQKMHLSRIETNHHLDESNAELVYQALKYLIEKYQLTGLTIRCFDLLDSIKTTSCLALARLNAEGIVAGCEGDIPTLIGMDLVRTILGKSSFQVNPCYTNDQAAEITFAHCTVPLDLVEKYSYDTHFESGLGVAIKATLPTNAVLIFRLSENMDEYFLTASQIIRNENNPNLCRTQVVVSLNNNFNQLFKKPLGNHHLIVFEKDATLFEFCLNYIVKYDE